MNSATKFTIAATFPFSLLAGSVATNRFMQDDASSTFVDNIYVSRDIAVYTDEAEMIVLGTVGRIGVPHWRQDQAMIQRDADIQVEEVLKGDQDMEHVTVEVEGGSVGGRSIAVQNGARLEPGERVVLFIGLNSQDEYIVYAGPYGKYSVGSDNMVSSVGDYEVPLDELLSQIESNSESDL